VIDIVRFDHISMAAAELDPQIELLQALFGFRYAGRFEEPGFFGANLDVPGGSGLGWEVLAPNGPDSYLHRFLRGVHGPGLHHVALRVPDIRAATTALRAEGLDPWGTRPHDDAPGAAADDPDAPGEAGEAGGAEQELGTADSTARETATEATTEPASSAPPPAIDTDPHGVTYIHPRQGGQGFLYQLYAGEPWYVADAFEDDGEHTLGIKAVNHLAHAHADRDELAGWYHRVFGMQEVYRTPDEAGVTSGFRTVVLDTPTRQLRFEVIAPAGPESFIQRFLEHRGPSMHHVTFEVESWERAVAACAHHGVKIFGERGGETNGVPWREAFIHPRDTGGMLVQFFWQAEPGVWI
jgi:methylmalonyl-CoA/ethylmalonyl-CoA epimerase